MALRIALLHTRRHDRGSFISDAPPLDAYLRTQAGQHQRDGIATTHVLVDDTDATRILGYCSLAAAQMNLHDLQPADRKHLPSYPVPTVRIARLAVSRDGRGKSYGKLLLGHALNCGVRLRSEIGVKVVLADALDERAAGFYRSHGFRETAENALTLYLPLGKV